MMGLYWILFEKARVLGLISLRGSLPEEKVLKFPELRVGLGSKRVQFLDKGLRNR